MKKSRHSENEIVKAVNQLASGISADIICREYGRSRATLYNWRSKYSGIDSSHIKRLKELEEENRRLKQMYADLALDNIFHPYIIKHADLDQCIFCSALSSFNAVSKYLLTCTQHSKGRTLFFIFVHVITTCLKCSL